MLQLSVLREQTEQVIAGLNKKNYKNAAEEVAALLELDQQRRQVQNEHDTLQSRANSLSKEIGMLMKNGEREKAEAAKAETSELKQQTKALAEQLSSLEDQIQSALYKLPNLPHESVPFGKSAEDNEVVLEHGQIPQLHEGALPHWELIQKYDIIDFELGNKVSGAGFPFYKKQGARLQRALINFFLDEAIKAGYMEVQPPIVVNEASGYGTGQLPDKDGQMYHATADNLYLIPTAEVPITNMYRDEIVPVDQLPIKNTGHTPCFRREAGSWGADVRGLNRLHQFDKVEIVQVTLPEKSYEALEEMSSYIQGLLQKLELPYRVLRLCGGDMGFTSALTYDMEVYSTAQGRWLEVSSASNFETYQANRLKLRYKTESGKTQLLHTLNGSALALPRIVAAILENNQTPDGINMPKVLHPYLGFEKIS
ncbi:serine--tRNA ligase [Pontibacter chinhatensis]|uniref:Serine--tRNA ligase n=1 Tax=Pontibacter chinhatensis TaxID=1436961 RepID=A0A1I2VEA8_9BACT|nr:serine--tRNA ligase [Pontibacter chinhatensis]SFG85501.1 seryl-tRNA synthetase [Pontibacter chinhatensis]